jgi:TonB family protein
MTHGYSLLADAAMKSIIVLALAALLTMVLRRSSAAVRHMLWTAAFAGLLALPVFTVALPALPVSSWEPAGVVFRAVARTLPADAHAAADTGAAAGFESQLRSRARPIDWPRVLAGLWLCGAGIGLAQIVLAWLAMVRIRRRARRFSGLSMDGVPILETRRGTMPMTFGLLRPSVFLPADATEWSSDRRQMVLQHELAHIHRGDTATHLLARIALSLYWWNPLAWIGWREFVRERERAADDVVLGGGARASDYAGHLLEIARSMQSAPAIGWAAVAMARRSQLEGRLLSILDSGVKRSSPRRAVGWMAALAAIALIAPLAALRAQDTETVPADVDATIRAAAAQKNHEMLDGAAKAAEAYQKYDLARTLLNSSLEIRGEVAGQQSVEYGLGLVKIGDLERDRRNVDEAKAFYTKAVSVLGNRPEAAPVLIDLGLLSTKDRQGAFDYFSQAQAADPTHAGKALMFMAAMRDLQKDAAAADALFQQAVAAAEPNSREAANAMQVYAAFLQRQGRDDDAKPLLAQAADIRKQLDAQSTQFRQTAGVTAFRVGNGVSPPTLAYKVEPEYSEEAHLTRFQGTVVVYAEIGADGTAQNMRVIRSVGLGLDEKALQAISKWKFNPGTKDGQPVPVAATIDVNFRLL